MKASFITTSTPHVVPALAAVASVVAHVALAVFAVGYGGGHGKKVESHNLQVEVDSPVLEDPEEEQRNDSSNAHPQVENHTHPYPLPPDHDEHAHSASIDHRISRANGELAAAPNVLVAADADRPTFSIVLGQSDSTGGLSGANGTGDGSGAGHGSGSGAGASIPNGRDEDVVFSEKTVTTSARLISQLRPEYPAAARAQGIEATVSLEIVVDRAGNVVDARVVRGAGYGFEDSALAALRAARFAPAMRDDHAVRVRMRWSIDFRLE